MAKISTYPQPTPPQLGDYVIGTDISDLLMTKNYLLSDIITLATTTNQFVTIVGAQTVTGSKTFDYGTTVGVAAPVIINLPAQTQAISPDGLQIYINGQVPTTTPGQIAGVNVQASLLDNICYFGTLYGNAGASTGIVIESLDAHSGNFLEFLKGVSSVFTTKFSVANNGDTTANSFIKLGGLSTEYLMADGSTSTMPTLQQVTTAGATTTNTITITPPVGQDGILIDAGSDTGLYSETTDGTSVYGEDFGSGVGVQGASVDGFGVAAYTFDGFAINALCDNAGGGGALSVDGGTGVGVGAIIQNGGVNILGLVNSLTGYQLNLTLNSAAKPSTNTWTIASDERVKTNVNPYTKGLEAILAINPITYDYNGKAGFDSKNINNIGIIAQDVLKIIPECINTYKAKLNEDDEEKIELYNFDSHALTFILINAIKELKAEIESLKSK
jgi:hypothetical protein